MEHREKLRLAGIKRHGSEEAWREFQRASSMKADRTTPRGFAVMDKEKVKEISRRAAQKRWHSNGNQE
jgi:hypothetical protein